MADAVTAMTRMPRVAGSSRKRLSAVMPSMPGSWMSISTSAGWRLRASSTPSSPVSLSIVWYPLNWSTSRTSRRFFSLSSTIRISSPAMGAHRDGEGEGRPLAELALERQRPAVELDQPPREGEAEPGALPLPCVIVAHLAELLEHRRLVLCRDPDAGIGDRHRHRPAVQRRAHGDLASLRSELDRVGQKVEQHLLDLALVGHDLTDPRVHVDLEPDAVARGALPDERQRVVERGWQVEGLGLQLHPARLDLRQVENIVDQREEVLPGGQDVIEVLLLLGVDLAEHPLQQHLGEADHGVERRAQLVGHVGKELRLVTVGDLELPGLVVQLGEEPHVLDGDDSLVRERLEERDLLVRKWPGFNPG